MFCVNCGKRTEDNAVFCPYCGADLRGQLSADQSMRAQPYNVNSYIPEKKVMPRKKSMVLPVALIICFAILLLFAGVVAFIVFSIVQNNGPLHGAKIKKELVWETDALKVTAKSLHYNENDEDYPYYITLEAVNSGQTDKTITCDAAAVNNIKVRTDLNLSVPAGGSANGNLIINEQWVKQDAAFSEFYSISFVLSDGSSLSDLIELKTGLKEHVNYLSTGDEDQQYDSNGIKVNYVTLYPMYSDYGPAMEFYIENNTDKLIHIKSTDVTIKGGAAESRKFDDGILPHTCGYVCIVLNLKQMEENDLLPLKDIRTEFEFYDPASGENLFTVPINVSST